MPESDSTQPVELVELERLQARNERLEETLLNVREQLLDLKVAADEFAVDNRRFCLDQANKFFHRAGSAPIISGEAVLHCAEMFNRYITAGEVPSVERAVEAVTDYATSLVFGAFPSSFQPQMKAAADA